ncbi:apolipoprotein D and lipocalin family protein [Xanthomonas arboricola]|uniref:Apolipoprotein D and lipocalin family protein n=2 Tax=Xanthomonas cannabis TaxID=1885674 RepID=A0ABR6JMX5_9XANT|nr:apolipoprotein D and lipocalin family protein [Xanthomonas cannabis]MBB5522705.1 apolipoprotein D and lipocalin family protein [Xanthomonas cannabis]
MLRRLEQHKRLPHALSDVRLRALIRDCGQRRAMLGRRIERKAGHRNIHFMALHVQRLPLHCAEAVMSRHPDLTTVPSLDLNRYLGTWYEIARLPIRFEDADCTDVSAHYSLQDDGSVRVQNRCLTAAGELEEAVGEARAIDDTHGRLEVTFLPEGLRWIPFTKGDYWVMRIDPEYTAALVGSPDRKYLWLLARLPQLDENIAQAYLAQAREQGFDLARLIHTPHTGRPTEQPLP